MDLEFDPGEVRNLAEMAAIAIVPEPEIRKAYERLIERAAESGSKPDSSFIMHFIQRPSFIRKSSYREKLLTLLGALQSSLTWSTNLRRRSRYLSQSEAGHNAAVVNRARTGAR